MDPRISIIDKRLETIKRIIAVSGGKGGIGKSVTASTLAVSLANCGYKVGLLDLDFFCPSTHIILGIEGVYPEEEKGVIPPVVHGVEFMSIVFYAGDNPVALRGTGVCNAIIELLTITRWDKLDYLIIDMPPGIGDAMLDIIRLIKRVEFLIITTGSKVVLETVKKLLTLLKELKVPIIGVVENMKTNHISSVKPQIDELHTKFLGTIDYDVTLESSLGNATRLLTTSFAHSISNLAPQI